MPLALVWHHLIECPHGNFEPTPGNIAAFRPDPTVCRHSMEVDKTTDSSNYIFQKEDASNYLSPKVGDLQLLKLHKSIEYTMIVSFRQQLA